MPAALVFPLAALLEIFGCYAFWMWLKLGRSMLWVLPGTASLMGFAALLAFAPTDAAGRAYAAYGGVYIGAALVWLWLVEARVPDRFDWLGGAICLAGAAIILYAPRN
jgi:small multidrug resistance family-3 protein